MQELLSHLNNFLWSFPLLFILMGTHLYFTMKLHVPQKHIFRAVKLSVTPEENTTAPGTRSQNLSAFGALATTLAATLGTGNIIGVSTAIALGGPGAVFWCWLTGILGMATSYAESYLSVRFRRQNPDHTYSGGPMFVLENGLHNKFLAKFYAICIIAAAFGVGCTTQSNSVTQTTSSSWGLAPEPVGMAMAIVSGLVIVGGIRSIGRLCTRLVPLLAVLYIGSCLVLLYINREVVPEACLLILKQALLPRAAAGGLFGATLQQTARYGIARGLFTNEAGIGTSSIAAAASSSTDPKRQAYVSMTAVFWDTVVMCLITGIAVVANILKNPSSVANVNEAGLTGAAFTFLPFGGSSFLSVSLIAFAITTLIGWSYFGEKATEYLFGPRGIPVYKIVYIVMIYVGAVIPLKIVWECTDLINAVMVIPNLIALYGLQKYLRY